MASLCFSGGRLHPAAAANTVKIVKRTFAQLSIHPASGKAGRISGTRELIFPEIPYIVIYSVRGDIIFILRVFHTVQDFENLPEQSSIN